mmetsp:Transcript_119398/g.266696  ORF Transcript_119398/g.266696 Transcript_119398/m.266696 type:complete len:420 (-) Transcript_119398:43-1302(-)
MGEENNAQVEEYQEQQEPPHMTYLKSLLPTPKSSQVTLMVDSNPISILDQHAHSSTDKNVVVTLIDNPFAKMVLTMKTSDRMGHLQSEIARRLGIDQNSFSLVVKAGRFNKKVYESDEICGKVMVRGISSFGQVCIPLVVRSKWMPGFEQLSQGKKNKMGGRAPTKKPKARVYVFYGPGDAFSKDWADYMTFSPEWIEVITYEWPGHGERHEEGLPQDLGALALDAMQGLNSTLSQHKPGAQAEIAPFAFVGHGFGALVMIEIAKLCEQHHQIRPASVFVLDRPAPSHPMLSEHGAALLKDDPAAFMAEWIPATDESKSKDFSNFAVEQAKYMGMGDGAYKFACPIYIYRASQHWSAPGEAEKKSLVSAKDTYEDWKNSTHNTAFVKNVTTDYFSVRLHGDFVDDLFKKMGGILQALGR